MPESITCLSVTTTWPSEEEAYAAARALVAERLAACAQVQGPIHSIYRWQGAVEEAMEWYCCLKTTVERFPALERRVRELHPYDVPEIVTGPIQGSTAYLAWVAESVE